MMAFKIVIASAAKQSMSEWIAASAFRLLAMTAGRGL